MPEIAYSFGDSSTPTETYHSPADVDVNGDGVADGVYLDFDGSGNNDSIAWDSDGDGVVDTILVSSNHDGVYDTAYTDSAHNGHWNEVTTYDAHTDTFTVDDTAHEETYVVSGDGDYVAYQDNDGDVVVESTESGDTYTGVESSTPDSDDVVNSNSSDGSSEPDQWVSDQQQWADDNHSSTGNSDQPDQWVSDQEDWADSHGYGN